MMTPKQIVEKLDEYIIGQNSAKRTIAVALRNRYRRMALEDEMKNSLKERKKQLEEDLNSLQVKMSNDEKLPVLAQRLFSLSETLIKSELKWINKELERSKK